jgi:raffinose/stachyose/melibiose transport system substrate-binding protein
MKKWIGLTLMIILAVVLTACGNNGKNTAGTSNTGAGSQASNGETSNKENVTLSFIHWRGEDVQVLDSIIAKFEQEYPHIKVETQVFPSDQYQSTAQAKLADGSVGDVFTAFPGAQFEAIAKAGLFADLSNESFVANFEQGLITAGQKDGAQYALPYQLVYNIPIYNIGLFEKYNVDVPKDWDSLLAALEVFKQAGITPIAFPGADIGPGQLMNSMVMNNAPDEAIFTKLEAGEAKLTDDWWVKTLAQFKELNDKGYLQKDAVGAKQDSSIALFVQEQAAILGTGSFHLAANKASNPNLKQGLLAPITVSEAETVFEGIHTTTFMLAVNSKSKHQEQAKLFIEFLSRPAIAAEYANGTGQNVTVKDVEYTSEELNIVSEWTSKKTRFQPRFTITNGEVQKAVTNSIQAVLSGVSAEEAAADAQAIVEQQIGN